MRLLIIGAAAAALALPAPRLAAQAVTIDSGMTRDQVVARLGTPRSARSRNGYTYLLYSNGCEATCGMQDLVVLDSGRVVDAVFRAAGRTYSGTSSSPRMISSAEARKSTAAEPLKTGPTPARSSDSTSTTTRPPASSSPPLPLPLR